MPSHGHRVGKFTLAACSVLDSFCFIRYPGIDLRQSAH